MSDNVISTADFNAEGAVSEDLPDDFAIELGRLLFLGGRVEMLLDRCLVPTDHQPPRRGLSGVPLVKELDKIHDPSPLFAEIVRGYEAMHEVRNHLVHGAHQYANRALWTWREPTRAKGEAAFSFVFQLTHLQDMAQSWNNLADAIEVELSHRASEPGAEA